MNKEDSVNISLEKYERMVRRIEELEIEVENKTIEVPPKWWDIVIYVGIVAMMVAMLYFH